MLQVAQLGYAKLIFRESNLNWQQLKRGGIAINAAPPLRPEYVAFLIWLDSVRQVATLTRRYVI